MKPLPLILALALLLAACAQEPPPAQAPPGKKTAPSPPLPAMSASGLKLYFHKRGPTAGAARRAVFELTAGKFTQTEGHYTFQDFNIRITEDQDREAIQIDGKQGQYTQDKTAQLQGGIHIQMGQTSINAQDLTYDLPTETTDGLLHTSNPMTIQSPQQNFNAQAFQLNPKTRDYTLKNGSARILLRKDSQ